MLFSGEDTTSVLTGFTVTKGEGMWSGVFQAKAGGGIFCLNSGAKITYCKIVENELIHDNYALGAGISCVITNGDFNIVIENNTISDNVISVTNTMAGGGGVFIGGASPAAEVNARIAYNKFENNHCECAVARADGGAVKTELSAMASGTFYIIGNTFQYNSIKGNSTRGGGVCGIGTGGFIYNNDFRENFIDDNSGQFRGAAIAYKTSSTDIEIIGNIFIENNSPISTYDATGAVSIMDPWENRVLVDRNFFLNNEGRFGAGFYARRAYNLSLSNNVFYGNAAYRGGCIYFFNPETDKYYGSPDAAYLQAGMINNSFVNNTATYEGGAVGFAGTHTPPVIFNSIFWNNSAPTGPDIVNLTDVKITVSYSRIDESAINGVWTGGDNFNEDPLLEPEDSLCHIYGGPCQNTGIDQLEVGSLTLYAPDIDYDGDPRPQGAGWDIGADECLMEDIGYFPEEELLSLCVSPNPSTGNINISYEIKEPTNVSVAVLDLRGKTIKSLPVTVRSQGKYTLKTDLSTLPDGLYFIRLQAGNKTETSKIIILK